MLRRHGASCQILCGNFAAFSGKAKLKACAAYVIAAAKQLG